MWGPGRAYPSTNVADVSITPSPAPTPSPSPPPPPVVVPSPPPPPTQSTLVGQVAFTTPGFFRWTVPSGVTSVSVVCIGAGGGAGTYVPSLGTTQPNTASGGGGEAYAETVGALMCSPCSGKGAAVVLAVGQEQVTGNSSRVEPEAVQQLLAIDSPAASCHMLDV